MIAVHNRMDQPALPDWRAAVIGERSRKWESRSQPEELLAAARSLVEQRDILLNEGSVAELIAAVRTLNSALYKGFVLREPALQSLQDGTVLRDLRAAATSALPSALDSYRARLMPAAGTPAALGILRECGDELDVVFDLLFGVPPSFSPSGRILYVPTRLQSLLPVIEFLNLTADDLFLDVGCAFGRGNLLVALGSPADSLGLDSDGWKVAVANQIARQFDGMPRFTRLRFEAVNAFLYAIDGVTVAFLFQPFLDDELSEQLFTQWVRSGSELPRLCTQLINPEIPAALGWRRLETPNFSHVAVFDPP